MALSACVSIFFTSVKARPNQEAIASQIPRISTGIRTYHLVGLVLSDPQLVGVDSNLQQERVRPRQVQPIAKKLRQDASYAVQK